MKKTLALLLALVMVLALAACGGGSAAPEAPAEEAPAAEAPAAEAPAAAEEAPAGDDFAQWQDYLKAYAMAGAPSEEEGQAVSDAIAAAGTPEEVEAIPQLTVLFENVGVLTYDAWLAAGKPEAETEGMGSEADNMAASGEPSEEPAEEPAGEASGEPSGEPSDGASEPPASAAVENSAHGGTEGAVSEADYQAYLHAWLDAEFEANSTMDESAKAEFEACIDAMDFETFPGDMFFNGMLTTGAAMTFDEFVAANGVY